MRGHPDSVKARATAPELSYLPGGRRPPRDETIKPFPWAGPPTTRRRVRLRSTEAKDSLPIHPARSARPGSRLPAVLSIALGVALLLLSAYCSSIHRKNDRYLLNASAFIFDGPGDDESKAIALSHFVAMEGIQAVQADSASTMARIEHSLPLELSPVTVLREGFAFRDAMRFGPCGQLTRTVHAIAVLRHVPSHKVLIETKGQEHAMVTLYARGADRLFDPTFDFYWTNRSGHVASIDEVRNDPEIFAQIYRKVPWYPYRLEDVTYFRWSRLGAPGRWLRRGLSAVLGASRVDHIDTPMLYERPWLGYSYLCAAASLLCLGLGIAGLLPWRRPAAKTVESTARALVGEPTA